VAVRAQDLDYQQPHLRAILHQDRLDAPLHSLRTAHLDVVGTNQVGPHAPLRRGRRDRNLHVRDGLYLVAHAWRQVDGVRRAVEDALASPDTLPLRVARRDGAAF
jgi:hypothetical protein